MWGRRRAQEHWYEFLEIQTITFTWFVFDFLNLQILWRCAEPRFGLYHHLLGLPPDDQGRRSSISAWRERWVQIKGRYRYIGNQAFFTTRLSVQLLENTEIYFGNINLRKDIWDTRRKGNAKMQYYYPVSFPLLSTLSFNYKNSDDYGYYETFLRFLISLHSKKDLKELSSDL
jgi:hypothetical protein